LMNRSMVITLPKHQFIVHLIVQKTSLTALVEDSDQSFPLSSQ